MKGILKYGTDFRGALNYDNGLRKGDNKKVRTLSCKGVDMRYNEHGELTPDIDEVVRSFELQASLNPRVEKPVIHVALSWSRDDQGRLSDKEMVEVAEEYLAAMGWKNTQYVVTRHDETDNDHFHITVNKVDNNGKTLNVYQDRRRNAQVCRQITLTRKYTWGRHKTFHKCDIPQNSGARCYETVRYEMSKSIAKAMSEIDDIEDLPAQLLIDKTGISTEIRHDRSGNPQGFVFSMMGRDEKGKRKVYHIPGRKIDSRFTYHNIQKIITHRNEFASIVKSAAKIRNIYDSIKESYIIPKNIVSKCEELRIQLSLIKNDGPRIKKEMADTSMAHKAVVLSLLYMNPLQDLTQFLSVELVQAMNENRFQRISPQPDKGYGTDPVNKIKIR